MRFTCSAPVAWSASFQWFADGGRVEADQFTPDQPFRIAVHRGEDRAVRPEELAYTVLEVLAERLKIGRVSCLISANGTGELRRLRLSSPYVSSDGGRLLHFSHNASCTRQSQCVDGNSSCYADLTTQVRQGVDILRSSGNSRDN
ncbi:hypothetical protein V5799_032748 [Amblyomma americanum]|uniref:Uncharacterized protein n=1 Tax=Amblyomma americanum TaxID=6943 RepID=A0AAQ4DQA5_AMBAM